MWQNIKVLLCACQMIQTVIGLIYWFLLLFLWVCLMLILVMCFAFDFLQRVSLIRKSKQIPVRRFLLHQKLVHFSAVFNISSFTSLSVPCVDIRKGVFDTSSPSNGDWGQLHKEATMESDPFLPLLTKWLEIKPQGAGLTLNINQNK